MDMHLVPTEAGEAPVPPRRRPCAMGSERSKRTFAVMTEELGDGVPVVSIIGELDLATAPTLEPPLLAACNRADGAVAVDLGRCGFIDLRGLHVLLAAQERLERDRRRLILITGNPDVLRILQVTRVDGLFEIHSSRAAMTREAASA